MKRFLSVSAVLAIVFVSLWVNVLTIPCDVCKRTVLRTNLAATLATLCGTDYPIVHASCVDWLPDSCSPFPVEEESPEGIARDTKQLREQIAAEQLALQQVERLEQLAGRRLEQLARR